MRSNRCRSHPFVIVVLIVCCLLFVTDRSAQADLQFDLNKSLNGSISIRADNSLNWYLRVTASDVGTGMNKSVKLTITGNLGGSESIHSIGFNIANGITPGALTAIDVAAIGGILPEHKFKCDRLMVVGGGDYGKNFDYRLDFATANNEYLFSEKDEIVLKLQGVSASDLNYLSPNGVYFGAHIQRLPGGESGFVGNVPLALPEPTGFMLALTGMLPLGVLVRRVRSWTQ